MPRRGVNRAPRPEADVTQRPVSKRERAARAREVSKFFGASEPQLDVSSVELSELVPALLVYAQLMYDRDESLGRFRQLLLGIQDVRWQFKGMMSRAWDVVRTWEALEPTCSHVPVPAVLFKAFVSVALLLGWTDVAILIVIMFTGLLRPGEAVCLTRDDVVLPSDLVDDHPVAFVRISRHKTVLKAGQQHVAIRDINVVSFLERVLPALPSSVRIFRFTPQTFRKRWDVLCERVGVVAGADGFTPASLRAGGATFLYSRGTPIPEIRWMLRHVGESSTAHYVQEAGAALASAKLPRLRVACFARAAPALLRRATPLRGPERSCGRSSITFNLANVVWTEDDI